jgi:type I restriction enzyme S subunit
MLPDGWKLTTLGKVCEGELQTGPFGSQLHAYEYQEAGVPVLMPKDIINCRADISNAAKISKQRADDLRKHRLLAGDLLFSRRGDVARFALIDERTEGSICGTGCLKARPSKNHSPIFLSYILQKNTVKTWLEQNAVGQTMPNMNTAILTELPLISASSREEEDKVAKILFTWDKATEKLEALIAAKQKRKKALMQQLLTGKMRFAGFDGEWKEVRFSSLLKGKKCKGKIVPTNDEINGLPYIGAASFSGSFGLYTNAEDAITCTKDDILILWDGENAGKAATGLTGAVSSTVVRFKLLPNIANNEFITYFLLKHNYKIRAVREGSGIPHMPGDFENWCELVLPSLPEQQKIAAVLSSADKEITIHQNQLAALKQQKTGLMQQLLTGKKRVQIDQAAA